MQQQQRANGKRMAAGAWSSVTTTSPSPAASVSSGSGDGGSASCASSAADVDELRSYYHKPVSSFRSIEAPAAASSSARVASVTSPLRSASPPALAAPRPASSSSAWSAATASNASPADISNESDDSDDECMIVGEKKQMAQHFPLPWRNSLTGSPPPPFRPLLLANEQTSAVA